jgi:hypothetical protein
VTAIRYDVRAGAAGKASAKRILMNACRVTPIRCASRSMAASRSIGKSTFTRCTARPGRRAEAKSRCGRLGRRPVRVTAAQLASVATLPVREAARALGVSVNTYRKACRAVCQRTPAAAPAKLAQIAAA